MNTVGKYPSDPVRAVKRLIKRLKTYKANGFDEERWAWGQAIKEAKQLLRCISE